ncbi:MAG: HAD family phosphatase, partial [Rectinema sp.]|nr:HAD family phosphatase [Rectinema sp.]
MMNNPSDITTVIFDCGSVITHDQKREYLCRMAAFFGADPETFKDIYIRERPEYDRGTLSALAYWNRVGIHFGVAVSETEVTALAELDMKSWFTINAATVSIIQHIKQKGKQLLILSNMNEEGRQWMYGPARYCNGIDWISLFDHIILSCDLKLLKPEPEIYKACLNRAGALPHECVFIDDSEANVRAAQSLGIHAIRFDGAI